MREPQNRLLGEPSPLYEEPSSASSALLYKRAYTHRASEDKPQEPALYYAYAYPAVVYGSAD